MPVDYKMSLKLTHKLADLRLTEKKIEEAVAGCDSNGDEENKDKFQQHVVLFIRVSGTV